MSLALTLLPAFAPVISDVIRGVVGRFTGGAGAQPQNVDEAIKLMQAEAEKLKALADLDRPTGNISQWVADLRASFRYVAGGVVILAAVSTLVIEVTPDVGDLVWQSANSVWAFLFGDRMYTYIKRGK